MNLNRAFSDLLKGFSFTGDIQRDSSNLLIFHGHENVAIHSIKANASKLDMVLFVADKISWDSTHNQSFICDITCGLENSLEQAAFVYLKFVYDNKENVDVFHPCTMEAYIDLCNKLK